MPPNVSAMPKPMAPATLSLGGANALTMRVAIVRWSVSFHSPADKKRMPSSTAQTQATAFLQPAIEISGAAICACGILSSMLPILALLLLALAGEPADLAIVNATIHTANPRQPKATAMAVRQGRVVAIGDDVKAVIGPKTRVIDLHRAPVIPRPVASPADLAGPGAAAV